MSNNHSIDDLAERGVEVLRRLSQSSVSLSDASFIAQWVTEARKELRAAAFASHEPASGETQAPLPLTGETQNAPKPSTDVQGVVERLRGWENTPYEGDPMIDALLGDVDQAATLLSAIQQENARLREALNLIAGDLQSSIDVHEFNSRHLIAEDSLQDAWKMLDAAREQFQVDANSLQIPLNRARTALSSKGESNA